MRSLDVAWERAKILRNWKEWLIRIKDAVNDVLSSNLVDVYVFGSAVVGDLVASSDIDLLVVAKNLPKSIIDRSEIKEKIIDKAVLPQNNPFEIHLVDEEEASIYFKHIKENFIKL
ncbi:MAG: nucleotidyltransferase domain-containing protein [Thermoprotei archaeon]